MQILRLTGHDWLRMPALSVASDPLDGAKLNLKHVLRFEATSF